MRFWDSSALVALLVHEVDTQSRAAQFVDDSAVAVWWAAEVACESAIRRRAREGVLSKAGSRLAQLAATWHEVNPNPALRRLAIRLLRTHPLRATDALQLAAPLTLANAGLERLVFVSADRRLNEAAQTENLTTIAPDA